MNARSSRNFVPTLRFSRSLPLLLPLLPLLLGPLSIGRRRINKIEGGGFGRWGFVGFIDVKGRRDGCLNGGDIEGEAGVGEPLRIIGGSFDVG